MSLAQPQEVVTGVYPDLSIEEYHGGPGISNSGLGDVDQSPLHYYARHLDPKRPPAETKRGQLEGTLAHCAILEPDHFDARFIVGPTCHRNTNKWKEFVAAHPDRIAIQGDQYDVCMRQSESVRALPEIASALKIGEREVSAYWNDAKTNVLCRCRPDWVHPAAIGNVLLDVKTYSSAAPWQFGLQAARKSYHRQAALYSDGYALASGIQTLAFIFVAVEDSWPFAACAVMLDDASMRAGHELYRANLDTYAECLRTNTWPGYSTAIELVSLPSYILENYL